MVLNDCYTYDGVCSVIVAMFHLQLNCVKMCYIISQSASVLMLLFMTCIICIISVDLKIEWKM